VLSQAINRAMLQSIRISIINRKQLIFDYLRQVNSGDTVFVRCASVCAQRTSQSDQFKTVKATDVKFDMHILSDSPDMTPQTFLKKGRGHDYMTP